jgi:hypothetical protein
MRLRSLATIFVAAVTLIVDAQPLGAVVVTAEFSMGLLDFGSSDLVPPPLLIATPGPTTGRLTYDTALAVPQTIDPENLSMTYIFTSGASLAIAFGGTTYTTSASAANPFRIGVGAQPANNFLIAGPLSFPADGVPAAAADPSNPLPAFPFLDLLNGNGSFANAALPTESFPNTFIDAFAQLRSVATMPAQGSVYFLRFLVPGDVTITVMPEPSTLSVLVLPAALVLLRRRLRTCAAPSPPRVDWAARGCRSSSRSSPMKPTSGSPRRLGPVSNARRAAGAG